MRAFREVLFEFATVEERFLRLWGVERVQLWGRCQIWSGRDVGLCTLAKSMMDISLFNQLVITKFQLLTLVADLLGDEVLKNLEPALLLR